MVLKELLRDLLDDRPRPDEPRYDPAHIAGLLAVWMLAMGAIFWLLWSLLVYQGGLPAKIGPALSVLLGRARLQDFGFFSAPYDMGLFNGWVTNAIALAILILAVIGLAILTRRVEAIRPSSHPTTDRSKERS